MKGTERRYRTHVQIAAEAGARIVVLPEVSVRFKGDGRTEWLRCVTGRATTFETTIVAPYYDEGRPSNELVVISPDGRIAARYEKQHPAPIEAKRHERVPPAHALIPQTGLSVSSVICVDLDYNDLVGPVTRAGGILAVAANDWRGFEKLHHRTAVWSVVICGVPLIRATGHGVSSAFDPAGRVIASKSSLDGPVVLVADLPLPATRSFDSQAGS